MEGGRGGGDLEVKGGTVHEGGEQSAGCRVAELVGT